MVKVYNSTKSNIIADDANIAQNPITRTLGLLIKKDFPDGHGLVILPCCSIHTFFMKFSIDVLFVNKKNQVVAVFENVKKNRILPIILNSYYVVELPMGTILSKNIEKGDLLEIQK